MNLFLNREPEEPKLEEDKEGALSSFSRETFKLSKQLKNVRLQLEKLKNKVNFICVVQNGDFEVFSMSSDIVPKLTERVSTIPEQGQEICN